ncbi:FUSC family protein [Humitalea sp. 24SJ18S-53]|uniref:FUSC family protein n=1 Tax=Humitalea sp. 24SJ18S-53 TaxID=3422307 RepID=UPI003D663EEC
MGDTRKGMIPVLANDVAEGLAPSGAGVRRAAWLPARADRHAISAMEGLRASLAVGVVVAADIWVDVPMLHVAALAALLTCLGDSAGPIRPRLWAGLAFAVLGAVAFAGFGALSQTDPSWATGLAVLCIFGGGLARVWGAAATGVGNMLTLAIVLAVGHVTPPGLHGAAALAFVTGSLWATAMTLLFWRIDPAGPIRAAQARVWQRVAELARVEQALLAEGAPGTAWEAATRESRSCLRDAIEAARALILDALRPRAPALRLAQPALLALNRAEDVFAALIMLATRFEAPDPPRAEAAPLLGWIAAHPDPATAGTAPPGDLADPLLARIAAGLATTDIAPLAADAPAPPWPEAVFGPLRDNLTTESVILRHAARCAVLAGGALLWSLLWPHPFQQWLTLALVLTMQPFVAVTWQRALERILGTLAGAAVAAGLALLVVGTPAHAVAYLLICGIAFTLRGVSYGLFIACLTPCLLILTEARLHDATMWDIAAMRAAYTLAGGGLAVAASLLLWPSWENARTGAALRAAIAAHADYLAAALGGAADATQRAARRAAGLASNNLEASIARRLQEPAWHRAEGADAAIVADAALRRLAGLAMGSGEAADDPAWRAWIPAALAALGRGAAPPPCPAVDPPPGRLDAMRRQVALLEQGVHA